MLVVTIRAVPSEVDRLSQRELDRRRRTGFAGELT
jgi:hypothetical protein